MSAFQEYAFEDIIRIGIAVVILLAGFLSVIYIIWGGFLMILSGGNEEKIKPAVNHIRHAVIGIIFLIAILFILPIVMSLLGLPYGDYVKPRAIFDTISDVSETMFGKEISGDVQINPGENSPDTLPIDFNDL